MSRRDSNSSTNSNGSSCEDFVFSYEAILDDIESRSMFMNFLVENKSEECLLFVDEVSNLFQKKSSANKLNCLKDIYMKYFKKDSSLEINIPQYLKQPIEEWIAVNSNQSHAESSSNHSPVTNQNFLNNNLSKSVDNLKKSELEIPLKRIEEYIHINLKEGQFPKFLESKTFKHFIQSKDINYLSKIGEMKLISHTGFIETIIHDLKRPVSTLTYCKLIKHQLLTQSYWSTFIEKDNYKVFLSNNKYLLGSDSKNGVIFVKYEIIFDYSVENVINTILDTKKRLKYDKQVKSTEVIDFISKDKTTDDDQLATTVLQEVYGLSFPFQDREFILSNAVLHDTTDDMILMAIRSCESDKAITKKKVVRALDIGAWGFKKLDNNRCQYYQFMGADFRGNIPKSLILSVTKGRAKNYYFEVLELLKQSEKEGFKVPDEDDKIYHSFMRSLKENGSIAL
ncbi:hypothetical protein ABK040_001552 [Willaertia magna]